MARGGPRARKRRGALSVFSFSFFFLGFFSFLFTLQRDSGGLRPELLVTHDSCVLRSPAGHCVRRSRQLQTLKTRHVMRMGMRMRVRVDGGRRRWRKSLMKTSGHADTRVIHVMLHRRMHRVMMLRRTHWRSES